MELYGLPMAGSLAAHIVALEAELPVTVIYIDRKNPKTSDGRDFRTIAPHGYVPALRLPSGQVLNEGPAILQWLADQKPDAKLAPRWGTPARYELIDWLSYLATEVHKGLLHPILTPSSPRAAKEEAKGKLEPVLDYLVTRLGNRRTLIGEGFTVADAYLITLLNWYRYVGVDLRRWPSIADYYTTHIMRPAVARAIAEEMAEREKCTG